MRHTQAHFQPPTKNLKVTLQIWNFPARSNHISLSNATVIESPGIKDAKFPIQRDLTKPIPYPPLFQHLEHKFQNPSQTAKKGLKYGRRARVIHPSQIMETQPPATPGINCHTPRAPGLANFLFVPIFCVLEPLLTRGGLSARGGLPARSGLRARGGIPIRGRLPVCNGLPVQGWLPVHAGLPACDELPVCGELPVRGGLPIRGGLPVRRELPVRDGPPVRNGHPVRGGLPICNGLPAHGGLSVHGRLPARDGLPVRGGLPVCNELPV